MLIGKSLVELFRIGAKLFSATDTVVADVDWQLSGIANAGDYIVKCRGLGWLLPCCRLSDSVTAESLLISNPGYRIQGVIPSFWCQSTIQLKPYLSHG